jgi:hypothetical protein
MMPNETVDYRALLKRYIAYVDGGEPADRAGDPLPGFTAAELAAVRALLDELDDEHEARRDHAVS